MSDTNPTVRHRSTTSNRRSAGRFLVPAAILISITGSLSAYAGLVVPERASAQAASAIAQNFASDQKDIAIGALVSINKDATSKIVSATTDNSTNLIGIVADTSLVEISTPDADGQPLSVQVVTEGVTQTLVSDINGTIKPGDKITASPIRGIGMRLTGNAYIVGTAQAGLTNTETTTREVTDKDGSKTSVTVGRVPVRVSVGYYSGNPEENKTDSTPLIQRLANAIAGKEISTIRIVAAFSLLLAGFTITVVILRTAVASSLTSIGRNPLSADAIHRNFYTVALIALGILLVALATSYLALVI